MASRRVNLIPFSNADVAEMISNAVIFVPLGIYAGVLLKSWSFGKKLLFVFIISLIIEALQFALAVGAFDITDIVNNTAGGLIGLTIFGGIEKMFKNTVRTQRFINVFAAIGTVLMITFLFLLKMNLLPIRYQ
jgi:glycopeptide antibiotics resistance protein